MQDDCIAVALGLPQLKDTEAEGVGGPFRGHRNLPQGECYLSSVR